MASAGPTDISQVRTQRVNSRAGTQPHDEDTEQWPEWPGSLDDSMMSAILSHKVDIVELLLDKGINIKTFLTAGRLMKLYASEDSKETCFLALFENMRGDNQKTSPNPIRMKDVGKLITHMLDGYYVQRYSSDRGNNLPDDAQFENPFLHLLIWAVLNNLQDMAKLFWRKGLDSIAAALLAHALLSAMESRIKNANPNLYEDLEANSREFMDLAIGVLERCYRTNKTYTRDLLIGELSNWEKASCILIAMKTNNISFISARECQEVFNSVWMGQMTQENSIMKLLICMFIPPLIPLCVKFKKTVRDLLDEHHHMRETMSLQLVRMSGPPITSPQICLEGRILDENGQSSVETEMPQSGPSTKDSEDGKQGKNNESDVPISDERKRLAIEMVVVAPAQIGRDNENPEAEESSPNEALLQKSPSRLTEGSSKCLETDQRNCENLRYDKMKYFTRAKEKIPLFYQAPVVHFLSHVISYMAFLCLYSYVLISKFDQNFSVEDVILFVWVVNIFIDEICQVKATRCIYTKIKLKAYLADFWNIADILMILMFVIGMILKHLSYQETLEAARVVLGVNLITCFLRLLQMFSLNKEFGPKLVMIIRMVRNLTSFFVMLVILIVAYSIASHAILYPNTEITFNFLRIIFRRPYWNIYGELMLDEIEGTNDCTNIVELYRNGAQPRCPTESGKYVVPVLMGVYMLMCNMLLLILLISIFSNTYQMVQENADKRWRVQRYHQIQDYINRSMPVPFISFLANVYQIIVFLKEYPCQSTPEKRTSGTNVFLKRLPDTYNLYIREWERSIAQNFINSKQANRESIDNSAKAITLRLDQLVSKIDALEEQQHAGTSTMVDVRLVNLCQMIENMETKLQRLIDTHKEHKPGAEQESPEKTDERFQDNIIFAATESIPANLRLIIYCITTEEALTRTIDPNNTLQPFSELDFRDTVRKWESTIAQEYTKSRIADLKSFDHSVKAITLRLDQMDSKIDALQEQKHTKPATTAVYELFECFEHLVESESSTVDEPCSVPLDQTMDSIEEKLPRIDEIPEEHQPGAE